MISNQDRAWRRTVNLDGIAQRKIRLRVRVPDCSAPGYMN